MMMNIPVLIIITLFYSNFLIFSVTTAYSSTHPYTPLENIVLNCGSSNDQTSEDGREWIGDEHSKFAQIQEQPHSTTKSNYASTAESQPKSGPNVPFINARIFSSPFTYSFPVTPGPKFVRLYFYPILYKDFDSSKAYFDVKTDSITFLKNFSAYLVAKSLNQDSFVREFCFNVVESNQPLNLTFVPQSSDNYSYAFINGIEIVSMPTDLYYGVEDSIEAPKFVGQNKNPFIIYDSLALETIARMNMGGRSIPGNDDTGMYRKWSDGNSIVVADNNHRPINPRDFSKSIEYTKIRNYTAPAEVYQSALSTGNDTTFKSLTNLTCRLRVDRGFSYLVRLHFCEFQDFITTIKDRSFNIYLNNLAAVLNFNIIESSEGNGVPIYRDYVVNIFDGDDLFIVLQPSVKYSQYPFTILNGVEVFKISKSGNLAGPNPESIQTEPPSNVTRKLNKKKKSTLFIALGCGMGLIVILLCIICLVVLRRVKKTKSRKNFNKGKSNISKASSLPEEICRRFTLSEIKTATNDFDDAFVIGKGGFGNVFRGVIDGGLEVAVKRLNQGSSQGAREFVTEIKMLSQLRYVHLVSLIGYCDEEGEMILVYEYVANGTLRDHIYGSDNDPLTWKQRLEICVGAARGLNYLHSGVKDTIIHRDVKTANILLDDNWVAKVADFGLSKLGRSDSTAVSTSVKGTFGYLDPEYARNQKLTDKSDVFSFGVVLFEVLCARKPVDVKLDDAQRNLAYWAKTCISEGTIQNIIDPFLMGKIAPECFKKFVEIAQSCVRDQRIERPTMRDVMENLEFTLMLQEQADTANQGINPDGVYSYPEVSFRASDYILPRYDATVLDSTSLGSNTTGLSFLTMETELNSANMFSESVSSH